MSEADMETITRLETAYAEGRALPRPDDAAGRRMLQSAASLIQMLRLREALSSSGRTIREIEQAAGDALTAGGYGVSSGWLRNSTQRGRPLRTAEAMALAGEIGGDHRRLAPHLQGLPWLIDDGVHGRRTPIPEPSPTSPAAVEMAAEPVADAGPPARDDAEVLSVSAEGSGYRLRMRASLGDDRANRVMADLRAAGAAPELSSRGEDRCGVQVDAVVDPETLARVMTSMFAPRRGRLARLLG